MAVVIGATVAGDLFHRSMALRGWSRPDAGFLAALTAGACTTALVVAFLVLRLRAGPGRPGPSRTARLAALAGTLVAAWLMVLAWLEGGTWLTPHLVLWLWPGALLLAPVPTWIMAPTAGASWLAVGMAVNGLVYGLAATVAHLTAAAARGRRAVAPPALCAGGLVLGMLAWVTPALVPAHGMAAALAVLGSGGLALGLRAPRHGGLAAAAALPGLLLPALAETLLEGAATPVALVVAREVVGAAAVAGLGVAAALVGGGLGRLVGRR